MPDLWPISHVNLSQEILRLAATKVAHIIFFMALINQNNSMGSLINIPVTYEIFLNSVQCYLLTNRHVQCDLSGYRLSNHVLIHLVLDDDRQAKE